MARFARPAALAPLLYVSPTQISYVLNSSDAAAWIEIERVGTPYTPHGMAVPIAQIAPVFLWCPTRQARRLG
jgi:hypothetical protein